MSENTESTEKTVTETVETTVAPTEVPDPKEAHRVEVSPDTTVEKTVTETHEG